MRQTLCHKHPELLGYGVILLQEKATHRQCDVQNLVKCWDWEVLAQPPYCPDLAPCDCWLFACMKEHVQDKGFESEDDSNTTIMASLHYLSKDEYGATID